MDQEKGSPAAVQESPYHSTLIPGTSDIPGVSAAAEARQLLDRSGHGKADELKKQQLAAASTMSRKQRPNSTTPAKSKPGPKRAAGLEPPEGAIANSDDRSLLSKRTIWTTAALALVIVLAIGLGFLFVHRSGWMGSSPATSVATFVGSETCAGCHQGQAQLWHSSQHKLAMQHATDKSVLGDFNDASFDYYGVRSRFFRKDGKFFVETDGPDGKLATFEVKYTFGVDPLQQYLIEFPDGRLQALSLAWDTRPKEQGGQRWFHLYPNEEIKHDDVLHWTKLNQNWNFMCAECHSTGVRKNYDAASDRFATTWAEISVGCEACHGQGSRHVAWARDQQELVAVRQDRRSGEGPAGSLRRAPGHRLAARSEHRQPAAQFRAGRCCARRSRPAAFAMRAAANFPRIGCPATGYRTRMSSRRSPRALLCRRADARRGLQLRLVQAEQDVRRGRHLQRLPRAAQRQAAAPGDGVCLQCHAPDKYARATHHHHERRKPAARLRVLPHARPDLHGRRSRGTITASASRGRICR